MIPGEVFPAAGTITLNEGRPTITLMVANSGDRPIQVGSHTTSSRPTRRCSSTAKGARYAARHPAGTAVRFEPGQSREVTLVPCWPLRLRLQRPTDGPLEQA